VLGTFDLPEEAARAYDAVAWQCGRPDRELNFSNIQSREEAKFLEPSFHLMSRAEELLTRRGYLRLRTHHADEAAMAAFRATHPEHV
jgi:hypothetical protein